MSRSNQIIHNIYIYFFPNPNTISENTEKVPEGVTGASEAAQGCYHYLAYLLLV